MTAGQREKLIQKLTETAAEIMGVPPEFFITTIKELPDENIGIGGKTIDKVKKAYLEKKRGN